MSRNLDRDDLLVPATRYYMGRRTIGVTAHCQALAKAWPELSAGVRDTLKRDIDELFRRDDKMRADPVCSPEYYPLGDDIDRQAWDLVRAAYSGQETVPAPEQSIVKAFEQSPRRVREHGETGPTCDCGGQQTWCSQCLVWSKTCCVDYGTCQCS